MILMMSSCLGKLYLEMPKSSVAGEFPQEDGPFLCWPCRRLNAWLVVFRCPRWYAARSKASCLRPTPLRGLSWLVFADGASQGLGFSWRALTSLPILLGPLDFCEPHESLMVLFLGLHSYCPDASGLWSFSLLSCQLSCTFQSMYELIYLPRICNRRTLRLSC